MRDPDTYKLKPSMLSRLKGWAIDRLDSLIPLRRTTRPTDYQSLPGRRSTKAERLANHCLGDFGAGPIQPATGDRTYLRRKKLLLFGTGDGKVEVSSHGAHALTDLKGVVVAWIAQRAAIPAGIRAWLVRDDSAGSRIRPSQGLHLSGVRPIGRRDLVLVPTGQPGRGRFLGLPLAAQLEELRRSWVPWQEKSDTVWWGGAVTGDRWTQVEPRTLTRREVLYHFRDRPSDRVRLIPTEVPPHADPLEGLELEPSFTKASAFLHKCLLLLPGNDIASGASWYFAGNSVVLMPRPHLDHMLFFEIEPWVHYVPVENDPADVLVKLQWVLDHPSEAQEIVANSHERLQWLSGPEYLWACNEVLRRIAAGLAMPR